MGIYCIKRYAFHATIIYHVFFLLIVSSTAKIRDTSYGDDAVKAGRRRMLRSNLSKAGVTEQTSDRYSISSRGDSLNYDVNEGRERIHYVRRVLTPTEFTTIKTTTIAAATTTTTTTTTTAAAAAATATATAATATATAATTRRPMNMREEPSEASSGLTVDHLQRTEGRSPSYIAATGSPSSSPTFSPTTFPPTTFSPTDLPPTFSPTTFAPFPSASSSVVREVGSEVDSEPLEDQDPELDHQTRFLANELSSCGAFQNKRKCNKTSGCSWANGGCVTTPSTTKCSRWNDKRKKCRNKGCHWNTEEKTCTGLGLTEIEESSESILAQTRFPSQSPTILPTATHTRFPTFSPTTMYPTELQGDDAFPSISPTFAPTTFLPSLSQSPTETVTDTPTFAPTTFPPAPSSSPTDVTGASPTFTSTTFPPFPSASPTENKTNFPPASSSSPVGIPRTTKLQDENDSLII